MLASLFQTAASVSTSVGRHCVKFGVRERGCMVLVSRLRTGHIGINKYLERIGKRDNSVCECGEEEQSETCIRGV